jgi:excisionase family DNA binding protein
MSSSLMSCRELGILPRDESVAREGLACLLTAGELAMRWQVPKSHVYRLTREGRIPTVKLGRY